MPLALLQPVAAEAVMQNMTAIEKLSGILPSFCCCLSACSNKPDLGNFSCCCLYALVSYNCHRVFAACNIIMMRGPLSVPSVMIAEHKLKKCSRLVCHIII